MIASPIPPLFFLLAQIWSAYYSEDIKNTFFLFFHEFHVPQVVVLNKKLFYCLCFLYLEPPFAGLMGLRTIMEINLPLPCLEN